MTYATVLKFVLTVVEKAVASVGITGTQYKSEAGLALLGLYAAYRASGRFDQAIVLSAIGLALFVGAKIGAK